MCTSVSLVPKRRERLSSLDFFSLHQNTTTPTPKHQQVEHMMMASRRAKTPHSSAHSASALYDLFRDPSVRMLLVSCLVLQISQQVIVSLYVSI
jgi:hypothetical protein